MFANRCTRMLMTLPRISRSGALSIESSTSHNLLPVSGYHTTPYVCAPPPKKIGTFKAGMTVSKKKMDVETDPHKLVNYLCGGNYKKDSPEIKLGSDSDYPDWLFTLRTEGHTTLDEMGPNSIEYWLEVRRLKDIDNRRVQRTLKGRLWKFKKDNRYRNAIEAKKSEFLDQIQPLGTTDKIEKAKIRDSLIGQSL